MIVCRELRADDVLPWTPEQIEWSRERLDPSTVWVAERDGAIVGMVIAANVHKTLFLLRLLGDGGLWLRPMARHIKRACFRLGIASAWTFLDNREGTSGRIAKLILRNADVCRTQEWTSVALGASWEIKSDAGTGGDSVAGSTD